MARNYIFYLILLLFYSCQFDNSQVAEKDAKNLPSSNNIRNYLIDVAGEITDNALG